MPKDENKTGMPMQREGSIGSFQEPYTRFRGNSLTRRQTMSRLAGLAFPIMFSFTFSFSLVELGIFTSRLGNTEQEIQDYLGATALITTYTQAVMGISLSCFYSISGMITQLRGKFTVGLISEIERNYNKAEVMAIYPEMYANIDKLNPEELIKKFSKIQKSEIIISYQNEVSKITKNGNLISFLISGLSIWPLIFSENILINVFKQNPVIAFLAKTFLQPFSLAVLPGLLRVNFEQTMFGFQKPLPATIMGLISFGLFTSLAYSLAFGPLAHWNLAGISYGFIGDSVAAPLCYAAYLAYHFKDYHFFSPIFSFDKKVMTEILKNGAPFTFNFLMELLAEFTIAVIAGHLGAKQLAAQNYVTQFNFFCIIPIISFGVASRLLMGNALALADKKDTDYYSANRTAIYSLQTSLLIMLPALILSFFPNAFTAIVGNAPNEDIKNLIINLLPLTAARVMFDTLRYNMISVLQEAGDKRVPSLISAGCLWFGVGMGWLMAKPGGLDIQGLLEGYALGFFLSVFTVGLFRWYPNIQPDELDRKNREAIEKQRLLAANQSQSRTALFIHVNSPKGDTPSAATPHLRESKGALPEAPSSMALESGR